MVGGQQEDSTMPKANFIDFLIVMVVTQGQLILILMLQVKQLCHMLLVYLIESFLILIQIGTTSKIIPS